MFALASNCWHKSKIFELALAIVSNISAVKIADVNLGSKSKMEHHFGNSTFVLKLVSESFHIKKCNLRPTSFPDEYFEV